MPSLRPVPHAYPLPDILNVQLIWPGTARMWTSQGRDLPPDTNCLAARPMRRNAPARPAGGSSPVRTGSRLQSW